MELCMEIKRLLLGQVRTNCYIVYLTESKRAVIIDPADDAEKISRNLTELGLTPEAVLLTHGHFDHFLAAEELRERYKIPIGILAAEKDLVQDPWKNVSSRFTLPTGLEADELYEDGQVLPYLQEMFRVIATPGHTVGSCCYYAERERVLFSGDTLFCENVGRTDLPTGDEAAMEQSIEKLMTLLSDRVLIYTGHGQETTMRHERQHRERLLY